MAKKISTEEFKQKVFDYVGDEYEVVGEYYGTKTKIKMIHKVCGNMIYPQPYEFLKNETRCRHCSNRRLSIGQEEFEKRIKEITNDEYVVLGNYLNNHENIEMKHKVCGQHFSPKPSSFLSGTRCPFCAGRKSNEATFKRELADMVGDEYILQGTYVNKVSKVDLLHRKCGRIYSVAPVSFLKSGRRCPICYHKESGVRRRKSNSDFVNELSEKFKGQIVALESYITANKKIRFKHISCGEIFSAKPGALITDNAGCPRCSQSIPETIIEGYLLNKQMNYEKQYRLADCLGRTGAKLPFDFAVFDKQDSLFILLEYDGEQHYRPSFGKKNFNTTKRNDEIKNNYCKSKNIKLIRIPYWEKNNLYDVLDKIFQL